MNETIQTINDEIDNISWWHSINLGNGIITKGASNNESQLSYLGIPDNLQNKTVLDIGAWDGYFSFLAEDRGAIVTATDSINHSWGLVGTGKKGFDCAKKIRQSNVKEYISEVLDLSPLTVGMFDIVFCFGVLYHVKAPYLLLDIIYQLTKEFAIIETASANNLCNKSILEYYRLEFDNDPSNYFRPNINCLIAMLADVGFSDVHIPHEYPQTNEPVRIAVHAFK